MEKDGPLGGKLGVHLGVSRVYVTKLASCGLETITVARDQFPGEPICCSY